MFNVNNVSRIRWLCFPFLPSLLLYPKWMTVLIKAALTSLFFKSDDLIYSLGSEILTVKNGWQRCNKSNLSSSNLKHWKQRFKLYMSDSEKQQMPASEKSEFLHQKFLPSSSLNSSYYFLDRPIDKSTGELMLVYRNCLFLHVNFKSFKGHSRRLHRSIPSEASSLFELHAFITHEVRNETETTYSQCLHPRHN